MVRIGRTVLALDEPVSDALARIERPPTSRIPAEEQARRAPPSHRGSAPVGVRARERGPGRGVPRRRRRRAGARAAAGARVDLVVMAAAVGVLALSLAGLVWLLRG